REFGAAVSAQISLYDLFAAAFSTVITAIHERVRLVLALWAHCSSSLKGEAKLP
ncbi:MAG: hypothetical protein RL011_2384, partial [Pseudomonadota bacterium]